jgi:competence protein ComEC
VIRGTSLLRIYAALGGLVTGIALAGSVPRFVAVGVGCCALAAAGWRRRAAVSLIGLIGTAASCGVLVTANRATPSPLESLAERIPHCELRGRLLEHAGGLGSLVSADLVSCEGFTSGQRAGVVVIEPSEVDAGALVSATGWLIPLRADDSFDDARRGLGAHSAFHVDDIEQVQTPRGLYGIASDVRAGLDRATAGMDPERAGLLSGLSTGDTTGIGGAAEEQLRRAGLSHLVAVSGSNVAIVVGATALMVSGVALPIRIVACGLTLGLFVLVVGPEPSVLRASVMGTVGLLALAAGRRTEPLHALGLALIVLLGLRPGLLSSVGLHLSVAATAGIVLFSGRIRDGVSKLGGWPRFVSLALAVTLSAQFAVAPILVGTFGELPLVAPLANLLAIPAVAPATVLGLMAAVTGALVPPVGWLCARIAEPFVTWVLAVGRTTGSWSWASIEAPKAWAWPLWGLVIAAALMSLRTRSSGLLPGAGEPELAGGPK